MGSQEFALSKNHEVARDDSAHLLEDPTRDAQHQRQAAARRSGVALNFLEGRRGFLATRRV